MDKEAVSQKWIDCRTELPDEDVRVLVSVWCESEDHDGVTQRWQEVHEANLYRGGCDLIAATIGDGEYMNEEIDGWMHLPEPVSGRGGDSQRG